MEDYLKAVDFLTIDDKHTIAKQLSNLEEKKNIDKIYMKNIEK
ncbi:MAG: hypothetical protein WBQ25_20840 [Nitrososphaeraceae archaeon]